MRNVSWVVGVDEVGRGPWAGPVAVGVYAVPHRAYEAPVLVAARDSKQLTPHRRAQMCGELACVPSARYTVTFESAAMIDRFGIRVALARALARALSQLRLNPAQALVLLDGGLHAPATYPHQRTIVRGDASERTIAAASIIAKVARDARMCSLAKKYPHYGFERHKGYGTPEHRKALLLHGVTPLHRTTFIHFLP